MHSLHQQPHRRDVPLRLPKYLNEGNLVKIAIFAKVNFAETFAHFLAMSGKVKSFPIVDGALISDTYPKSFLIPANIRMHWS